MILFTEPNKQTVIMIALVITSNLVLTVALSLYAFKKGYRTGYRDGHKHGQLSWTISKFQQDKSVNAVLIYATTQLFNKVFTKK